jgi:hypothetical protein
VSLKGGVSRGGQDDIPMGKASVLDKATGKIEKVGPAFLVILLR